MKKQQGFTLIELMIAVAIIGILAAVAIPQYQDYTARAQVSEAVTLLGGLKTPVIDHYTMNGVYPDVATIGGTSSGQFVSDIVRAGKVYTATFNTAGVSKALQSKKIQLEFFSDRSPVCSTPSAASIPAKLLPKACQ